VRLPGGRRLRLDRAARRALARSGAVPGSPEWVALAEEIARPTQGDVEAEPGLAPAQGERLGRLARRVHGLSFDGPRAAHGGGWQVFVGGLPDGAWVLEYGASPEEAVARALARAEALAGEDPPDP
jgi:hypothetical protein